MNSMLDFCDQQTDALLTNSRSWVGKPIKARSTMCWTCHAISAHLRIHPGHLRNPAGSHLHKDTSSSSSSN